MRGDVLGKMCNSINTSSAPSTFDLWPVIIKLSCRRNASYGGVAANVAAQSSTSVVDHPTCLLADQPASVVGSELMSTQSVRSRPVSAMRVSRSLPSGTFSSFMYCISSSLALLTISGVNGNPVLLSLNSLITVRKRQQLRLLQSLVSCRSRPTSPCAPPHPAARMLCRKAHSIVTTYRGGSFSQAFALPFNS